MSASAWFTIELSEHTDRNNPRIRVDVDDRGFVSITGQIRTVAQLVACAGRADRAWSMLAHTSDVTIRQELSGPLAEAEKR